MKYCGNSHDYLKYVLNIDQGPYSLSTAHKHKSTSEVIITK